VTCWAACLASVWLAVISADWLYVIAPVVLFCPIALLFRTFEARFSTHDVVLLPALIVSYLAVLELSDGDGRLLLIAPAWLLFIERLWLARGGTRRPGLLFAFAPLGIIIEHSKSLDVVALLIVFVAPLIAGKLDAQTLRRLLALVAYPAFVYFFPLACSLWTAEGMLRVNVFEAGHSVQPASDMRLGARPYRDTVPMHGFIEDAALDFVSMKLGARTLGGVMEAHELASQLNAPAMYAVTAVASASPATGLLAVLFVNFGKSFRSAVALFAIALMITAYRRRSRRFLSAAAALTVVACLTGLDFGAYALAALVVTAFLMRERGKAFGAVAIGLLSAAVPVAIFFSILGVLPAAISRSLAVGKLGPAYNLGFFAAPRYLAELRYFPDVALAFLQRPGMAVGAWIAAVLILAAGAAAGAPRRLAPLLILATFVAATGIAYAERHHLYPIENGAYPMLFCAAALLLRSRVPSWKAYGRVAAAILIIAAGITANIAVMSSVRRQHGTSDSSVVQVQEPRHARGVLFDRADAESLAILHRYFSENLGPGETFFDFTNHALLYYLFDRRCPVPMNEVATYETPAAQREVISRLESQREVRYALVPPSEGEFAIDGIPNRTRAPLVWEYLQSHFHPAFQEGKVVVWKRM
jgi:hypothetical protein